MKDWKWASVRGWPDRMIAARSHSINSGCISLRIRQNGFGVRTFIEISLIEIIRPRNIHVEQTSYLIF
jgi:hypothetical protein